MILDKPKVNSSSVLGSPVAGTIEFLTDAFYGTITSGPARKTFAFLESPAFTTPNLGTPSAGTLSSCSGLPVAGLSNLGANVGTWLITPSSANLSAAITDETGSGALCFATAPTFTTSIAFNAVTDTIAGIQNQNLVDKADTETITGVWTFSANLVLSANTREVYTLPATDAHCTGPVINSINAGYSSAVGDLVYFGSGGKWLEVDSNAVATCQGLLGIAMEAKTDGQAMVVALPGSFVHIDAWTWTVGDTLYTGETLGLPQNTIPTGANAIIKVIGFAIDADTIYFNPSPDQQSTVA